MPCYRCGVRQTDPERGKSPWRRGVLRDQLVLVCPVCQESSDWTADLQSCSRCRSVHLIRRLGQVECLDCGLIPDALIPDPGPAVASMAAGHGPASRPVARAVASPDPALAEEVGQALDRLLGRA
jgi:hypothetical protein